MAKLFIVGFPRDMSEIRLLEMFSLHGFVKTLTNVTDKETRIPKGYAFVTMQHEAGAIRAIAALNGVMIDGRTISVRFSDRQKTSELPGDNANSPSLTIKEVSSGQTALPVINELSVRATGCRKRERVI